MKRFFFLGMVILTFISGNSFGQNYVPMAVEDAHWIIAYGITSFTPYAEVREFFTKGDTILDGKTYKKVYVRLVESKNNNFLPPYVGIGEARLFYIIRDDSLERKVYKYILSGSCQTKEELLYDFSKSKGDSALYSCNQPIVNSEIDMLYRAKEVLSPTSGAIWTMWDDFVGFSDSITVYELWDDQGTIITLWEGIGTHRGIELSSGRLIYYCRGADCNSIITSNDPDRLVPHSAIGIYHSEQTETLLLEDKSNRDNAFDRQIEVLDLNGRKIKIKKWSKNDSKIEVSTLSFAPGVFFVKISDKGGIITKKILIRNN